MKQKSKNCRLRGQLRHFVRLTRSVAGRGAADTILGVVVAATLADAVGGRPGGNVSQVEGDRPLLADILSFP